MIAFFDRIFRPETTAFPIFADEQAGVVNKQAIALAQNALDSEAEKQLALQHAACSSTNKSKL